MKELEALIQKNGEIREGQILKVDSFLNHQLDIDFLEKTAEEFYRLFRETNPTRILTIEASGIALAVLAAQKFRIPVVFAKKTESLNLDSNVYSVDVFSYTKQRTYTIKVSKNYIKKDDRVLIIDDFLALGSASQGLIALVEQAGATLCGVGIAIEKSFQEGGKKLREAGVNLHSLAMVSSIDIRNGITFAENPDD
ncbi:MAG: xanthine phosphoribosyltransferase [Peptoniphilaceae bacterium]|nr:xanthine phosphoribosyltransferase [Peptoniphilaceae bacterium]MDY5766460.1 xanthine phosphoribosyltransferase [Peptoniphilaceae bacterium]MDY6147180.1 xanthine phosphoribosyltransferase [Peptoniphilaceae bacterium]